MDISTATAVPAASTGVAVLAVETVTMARTVAGMSGVGLDETQATALRGAAVAQNNAKNRSARAIGGTSLATWQTSES